MPSLIPGTENMLIHATRRKKKEERKEGGKGSRKEGREGIKKERKNVRWIGWIPIIIKDTESLLF